VSLILIKSTNFSLTITNSTSERLLRDTIQSGKYETKISVEGGKRKDQTIVKQLTDKEIYEKRDGEEKLGA
jgi:hypothetical protein